MYDKMAKGAKSGMSGQALAAEVAGLAGALQKMRSGAGHPAGPDTARLGKYGVAGGGMAAIAVRKEGGVRGILPPRGACASAREQSYRSLDELRGGCGQAWE